MPNQSQEPTASCHELTRVCSTYQPTPRYPSKIPRLQVCRPGVTPNLQSGSSTVRNVASAKRTSAAAADSPPPASQTAAAAAPTAAATAVASDRVTSAAGTLLLAASAALTAVAAAPAAALAAIQLEVSQLDALQLEALQVGHTAADTVGTAVTKAAAAAAADTLAAAAPQAAAAATAESVMATLTSVLAGLPSMGFGIWLSPQVGIALALTLVGSLSTALGGALVVLQVVPDIKQLGLLQGFASGLMLSLTFFDLVPEAIETIGFPAANL
ncbi:unnamed protein product, partial [Closterium sp. NIES-54]